MFWGKESSNRIELSWLVQELLKFGVLGSLRLWRGGRWVGGCLGVSGGMGGCPHMHAHACTHMHTHTCIELQMATSMEASMFSMFKMHVCTCVCMHACMGHPHTHPYLPPPHPPICHPSRGVDPRNHLKFDNTSTDQDISIPFEDLKSVKNSPPMGGCVVWWVGGWVDGWGQVKSLKI